MQQTKTLVIHQCTASSLRVGPYEDRKYYKHFLIYKDLLCQHPSHLQLPMIP